MKCFVINARTLVITFFVVLAVSVGIGTLKTTSVFKVGNREIPPSVRSVL